MIKNKIGICEWSLPIDGPYACKFIGKLGFDGLQLNIGDYERGFPMSKRFVQDAYLEMAEASGIEFPSLVARVTDYYTMFPSKDEEESEIVRSGIAKAIESCVSMRISILLIPNFEKSEITGKRELEESVDVFKWACDTAGKHNITIGMENTLSTEQTLQMIAGIDRTNLQLYFDTQNYYLHKGYDSPQMLDELMEHVCQIHVKDGKGKDLSGALLGQGDTDFYGCIEVVKKHGYTGWVVSENYYDRRPLSEQNPDTVALIREDLKILKDSLA